MCGEHCTNIHNPNIAIGSSPRVRGTLYEVNGDPFIYRFIPACAGNIGRYLSQAIRLSVHPRVCGEHENTLNALIRMAGSSPRVRGTSCDSNPHRWFVRFIPACAGNIGCPRLVGCQLAVHPRVCGEHLFWLIAHNDIFGSSPRVRGT